MQSWTSSSLIQHLWTAGKGSYQLRQPPAQIIKKLPSKSVDFHQGSLFSPTRGFVLKSSDSGFTIRKHKLSANPWDSRVYGIISSQEKGSLVTFKIKISTPIQFLMGTWTLVSIFIVIGLFLGLFRGPTSPIGPQLSVIPLTIIILWGLLRLTSSKEEKQLLEYTQSLFEKI
jgi:hypothetical protein